MNMIARCGLIFLLTLGSASLAYGFNTFRDSCTGFHNLSWPTGKVSFYLSDAGSLDLSVEAWEQAILDSFRNWEVLEESQIQFEYTGMVAQHPGILDQASGVGLSETRYGVWSKARNVVAFQSENWPEALHGARGVTFALFHNCDGHLLQTDIIIRYML